MNEQNTLKFRIIATGEVVEAEALPANAKLSTNRALSTPDGIKFMDVVTVQHANHPYFGDDEEIIAVQV